MNSFNYAIEKNKLKVYNIHMKKYVVNSVGNQARFLTRSFASTITAGEEDFALEQNKMVSDYVKKNFNITPHLITRDAMGNIIVATKSPQNGAQHDSFVFQMLGTNTDEKSVNLFTVGFINYIRTDTIFDPSTTKPLREIFVTKLAVQENYQKSGIGSIMLHTLENYVALKGYNTIRLNALHSYDVRNDLVYPSAQIRRAIRKIKQDDPLTEKDYNKLKSPELEKFLRKSMFNRNLFFYNSNGYTGSGIQHIESGQDRMQKTNLDIANLDFGYKRPYTLYKPSDERYSLPEMLDPIITLNQSYGEKLFSPSINYFGPESFVPIYVDPSKFGTSQLKNFLQSVPPSDELMK